MTKKYGVCFGVLAMGLALIGAPAIKAAGENDSTTTSATTAAATPAAASPADLDHRIEALEMELAELKTALAAKKETEAIPAVVATPGVSAAAQPAQDAAKPPEKTTIASLLGPTSISGFIDVYYNYNTNHPGDHSIQACSFDCRSQSISLNMIELILDKAPDATAGELGRTGYHFSAGYGDTQVSINNVQFASSGAGAAAQGFDQYVKEAYFSYLAPVGKGLQFDVGKFVTPMGAEVIESKDNWNYSRGLLFNYAIPLNHFGVRAKYTWNDKFNATGYFVNGFNNVVDNNSGKTYGVDVGWTPNKKNTVMLNYFAGPEQSTGTYGFTSAALTTPYNVNSLWRQTWDFMYMYNFTSKLTAMFNYDYVHGDRLILNSAVEPYRLSKPVYYTGGAGYLKYAFDDKDYVAGRYEYFYDRNGFVSGGYAGGLGTPHSHLQEFTATYQHTFSTHLLTRLEYRRDMSNLRAFELDDFSTGVKQQNVLTVGMIFLFDSRDAK